MALRFLDMGTGEFEVNCLGNLSDLSERWRVVSDQLTTPSSYRGATSFLGSSLLFKMALENRRGWRGE